MNKGVIIGIPIAIAVIIGIIVVTMMPEDSDVIEVEDVFDREIRPDEIPEIQDKLDEIQQVAKDNTYEVLPRDWHGSGPFQIDRKQYALGEKIFMRIGGLGFEEKGQVAVMRPSNTTIPYITVPFDGAQKDAFNYYFDPQLSKARGLCSVDDVLGTWTLVFRGTNYPDLKFEFINKTVPGTNWEPVC